MGHKATQSSVPCENTQCPFIRELISLSGYECFEFLVHFQEMIDEADKDGDGEVSEAEFLRIMKKTNMY